MTIILASINVLMKKCSAEFWNTIIVSAYGITDGSVIHMVGSKDLPPSRNGFIPPKEVPHRPTEPELVRKIQDELDKVHKSLVPPLNAFLAALPLSPQPPSKDLEREHLRLGELLLQSLLRLDALSPEGTWEDARGHRKVAVREVQGLLDLLDDGWKQFRDHAVT